MHRYSRSDEDSHTSQHSLRKQYSPTNSTDSIQSIGRMMDDNQRRMYETKMALARSSRQLNANLKAEIDMHENKRNLETRLSRRRGEDQVRDLVLGESALEIINMFKLKAEESRHKIQQLKQEVLNAQALTRKYKELYERAKKRQGAADEEEEATYALLSQVPQAQISDTSSITTANSTIANLKKKGINFEMEYERLKSKHQASIHESDKLKAEIQRLKNDNQRLISTVRRAEEDQREALNKYAASETIRSDLEKRLAREKKQHQVLLQTVRKQTAGWIGEHRQQQQLEDEDRLNSFITSEDRLNLRPVDKHPEFEARLQVPGRASTASHVTGLSNRGTEAKSGRANMPQTSQRKA